MGAHGQARSASVSGTPPPEELVGALERLVVELEHTVDLLAHYEPWSVEALHASPEQSWRRRALDLRGRLSVVI